MQYKIRRVSEWVAFKDLYVKLNSYVNMSGQNWFLKKFFKEIKGKKKQVENNSFLIDNWKLTCCLTWVIFFVAYETLILKKITTKFPKILNKILT